MDLSDPTEAVTATLDGPVLAVLATAGRPLTVGEVAAQAVRGSEIGIRRSLARLVDQGIVRATVYGRNQVHELNREHLAAPVADVLAGLRLELWKRFRSTLAEWNPRPLYACVFGSAARGDGDEASDIDLLLVHPPFKTDRRPARSARSGLLELLVDSMATQPVRPLGKVEEDRWQVQIDELRGQVRRWTGNSLQVVDFSAFEWTDPKAAHADLRTEVDQDGVTLAGSKLVVPVAAQQGRP